MASHALLSRQWRVPVALSRCRDIFLIFLSAVGLWLQQGATMETLGGKRKTGRRGEMGEKGRKS